MGLWTSRVLGAGLQAGTALSPPAGSLCRKCGDLDPALRQAVVVVPALGSHWGWAGAGVCIAVRAIPSNSVNSPASAVKTRQKILKAKLPLDNYETSPAKQAQHLFKC